ncbi:MAG: NAD(+)/NADH kinase [Myxococcales bacterium]
MTKIESVAVVAKPGSAEAVALAREVQGLLRGRKIRVLLEAALAGALGEAAATPEQMQGSQLVVVAGGDGTLIHAVRLLDGAEAPIFGINAGGQLGFLTEIPRARALPLLEQALAGECPIEPRCKLAVTLTRDGRRLLSAEVLNDAVINRGALARMVELSVDVDGARVSSFRADGVILATPTGSTAYSLAANGPILVPTLSAVIVNAICPHTLTQRALVVSDRCCIQVEVLDANGELLLSLDGQVGEQLQIHDRIELRRSEHRVLLVRNPELDFFQILRSKLHWGER